MKLSVVVVSWNVKKLLEACLDSLFLYSRDIEHEIIVIDNASHDGSADMVAERFPAARLVKNEVNLGFAVACNQGVLAATGEYVVFLNPDTVIQEGSFQELISFFDQHASVGCIAPQLLNPDGTIQSSVRTYPTPWSALMDFFHLSKDRDEAYVEPRRIEQPMGACMMMKRSVLNELGAFDEHFFLWFDEVDLCKRIRDAGYELWYVPQAKITHVGGKSFQQKSTLEKQKIFYTSYAQYLWKHYRWHAMFPVGLMKFYVRLISYPIVSGAFIFCAIAELVSFGGYFFHYLYLIGFVVVVGSAFYYSLKNLRIGFCILAAELIIDSKGYLFSFPIAGHDLPVRMGIFGGIFLAWMIRIFQKKSNGLFFKSSFLRWYVLLGAVAVWGIASGAIHRNGLSEIYQDANAWLFFILIIPLYDAIRSWHDAKAVMDAIVGSIIAHILTIFKILYVMSHQRLGASLVFASYRWIRETGLGEITRFEWGGVRVFFQSSIYPLFLFAGALPQLNEIVRRKNIKAALWKLLLVTLCLAIALLSFSRSYWLALFVALVAAAIQSLKSSFINFIRFGGVISSMFVASFLIIGVFTLFPFPKPDAIFGFDVFAKRFDLNESAAKSRWSLLPVLAHEIKNNPLVGSGFGKTITYTSYDPRVREKNASGTYTTFAFEWGYLDMMIKLGAVGFVAYLLFLWRLGRRALMIAREDSPRGRLVHGLFWAFCVLLVVHAVTPYLNHPLGIALLLFMTRIVDLKDERVLSART